MTEKEYREHPYISRSELWKMSESPEKFKWYKENPQEPTPSLLFGQFIHSMILTPDIVWDDFAVAPDVDRRTKEGKKTYWEWLESVGNKKPVSLEMAADAVNMYEAIKKIPLAIKLLSGETEKPLFWLDEMTGEGCKCRLDSFLRKGGKLIIVDYKTTEDAETEAFTRSAVQYGYDLQAAMYSEGVKANYNTDPVFVFVVQEKKPPYAINILQADELMVRRGYDLYREYIGMYHECKETGIWYGYMGANNMINNLSLPAWLAKEFE